MTRSTGQQHVCSQPVESQALQYAQLPAGVEPAPIGGPSGALATIIICPGLALHALAPFKLQYSLSAPMIVTAETTGHCVLGPTARLPLASTLDVLSGRLGFGLDDSGWAAASILLG